MPNIRQYIDPLPIPRTAKAVLTEVCELVEHGRRGCCDAQNAHFAERLSGSERTMTRALAELERLGLVEVTGQGKARRITPTSALRACYAAPTPAGRREAAAALSLANHPNEAGTASHQPRQVGEVGEQSNLDKNGAEPSQKWSSNLDKSGSQPSQKWFFTPYSGNKQETNTNKPALAARERARFEARIIALEQENAQLRQQLADRPPAASTKRKRPTQRAPVPAPQASAEPSAFEQFWNLYGKKVGKQDCLPIWEKLTLEQHQAVLTHVPGYVQATPDPKFRKDPIRYLKGAHWQDELPAAHTKSAPVVQVGSAYDKDKARVNNNQLTY